MCVCVGFSMLMGAMSSGDGSSKSSSPPPYESFESFFACSKTDRDDETFGLGTVAIGARRDETRRGKTNDPKVKDRAETDIRALRVGGVTARLAMDANRAPEKSYPVQSHSRAQKATTGKGVERGSHPDRAARRETFR